MINKFKMLISIILVFIPIVSNANLNSTPIPIYDFTGDNSGDFILGYNSTQIDDLSMSGVNVLSMHNYSFIGSAFTIKLIFATASGEDNKNTDYEKYLLGGGFIYAIDPSTFFLSKEQAKKELEEDFSFKIVPFVELSFGILMGGMENKPTIDYGIDESSFVDRSIGIQLLLRISKVSIAPFFKYTTSNLHYKITEDNDDSIVILDFNGETYNYTYGISVQFGEAFTISGIYDFYDASYQSSIENTFSLMCGLRF